MARHAGPVLVDTNVVLECWRIGAWRALTGGYRVEMVEDCVTETQTGFQRRRAEEKVDAAMLRSSLAVPHHQVSQEELAALAVRVVDIALDVGERSLWAHILTRIDGWVLCGPDRASMRVGVRLGFRERLVSLEKLLGDVGYRPRVGLKVAYTEAWLAQVLSHFVVSEGQRQP
jgi:hypothetical protein